MKFNMFYRIISLLMLIIVYMTFSPQLAHAHSTEDKHLIMYYSRTGNSEIVAKTLNKHIRSDLLEIIDQKNRSGRLGFLSAAIDSMFNRYTEISPSYFELSPYESVIVISPIWNWKLSVATRTALKNYDFEDKNILVVTTGDQAVDKYEIYDDDASFLKRYFRDYLRDKKREMILFVEDTGAVITGHYHIVTDGLTDTEISKKAFDGLENISVKLQD